MLRERVADNVYWFQSEIYAQTTAGAVVGPQWAVLIDTLPPEETSLIRHYLESELMVPVRYIINTHYHADHCWGNCFFPRATVISHELCRKNMIEHSIPSLKEAKTKNPSYRKLDIIPAKITFSQSPITLKIGKRQLQIFASPGHSDDGISVLVEEDRILFAGDAMMPVPYFLDGDYESLIKTQNSFFSLGLENIVQGHGDIVLRGEIEETITSNIEYLKSLQKIAKAALRRKEPIAFLQSQNVEDCGKNRISLSGLAQTLHTRNLLRLYTDLRKAQQQNKD